MGWIDWCGREAEIGMQSTFCNRARFSKLTNFAKGHLDFQEIRTSRKRIQNRKF